MGTLNKLEIERRLSRGELLKEARCGSDKRFIVEYASYDLIAGTVVRRNEKSKEPEIVEYKPGVPSSQQARVTLQPGQMMFVMTHEEVKMPRDLCGTVLSRNYLAKQGILALNAGHVDPGFEGPIVIRLISLRSIPWTLELGTPIFTIVFHTLDVDPLEKEKLEGHREYSKEETLKTVIKQANEGLSNALFDLYAGVVRERVSEYLHEHMVTVEGKLRKDFVSKSSLYGVLSVIALIFLLIKTGPEVWKYISTLFK